MEKQRQTESIPTQEMEEKVARSVRKNMGLAGNDRENQVIPSTLGRYSVLRQLGRGGMGCVYLAYDRELEREVAIKTVRKKFSDIPYYRERFVREAKIAASICHPNTVKIYDWGTEPEEGNFIVMEYVKGETLYQRVRKAGPLDLESGITMLSTMLNVLEVMNEKQIVHRDIKPANILLTQSGEMKLMDLGIAKSISHTEGPQLTQGGSPGTPDFMAPEQKHSHDIDIRADIFSLGKTFIYALTGEVKLNHFSFNDIAHKQSNNIEKSTRTARTRRILAQLRPIIDKMIEFDPNNRYSDPTAVLRDLNRAKPNSLTKRLLVSVILGCCLIFAIVFGALWLYNGFDRNKTMAIVTSIKPSSADLKKIDHSMKMIDEIEKKMQDDDLNDGWSSSPLVIVISSFSSDSNARNIADVNLALSKAIRDHSTLPVVERNTLAQVLQEINLDISALSDPQGNLQLQKLLPASILIEGSIRLKSRDSRLIIKMVNVQTTALIDILEEPIPSRELDVNSLNSVGKKVAEKIRQQFPLRGKITNVNNDRGEINLGSYHGVKIGERFQIFKAAITGTGYIRPEYPPIATVIAANVDKFSAQVDFEQKKEPATEGMLVMQSIEEKVMNSKR